MSSFQQVRCACFAEQPLSASQPSALKCHIALENRLSKRLGRFCSSGSDQRIHHLYDLSEWRKVLVDVAGRGGGCGAVPQDALAHLCRRTRKLQVFRTAVRVQFSAQEERGHAKNGALAPQAGSRHRGKQLSLLRADARQKDAANKYSGSQERSSDISLNGSSHFEIHPNVAETLARSKVCQTCGVEKPIGDFKRSIIELDSHLPECHACTVERRAVEKGIPFRQKQMRGKVCSYCRRYKEAVDFNITRDWLQSWCRSCFAALGRSATTEEDVPLISTCNQCGETKPASEFYLNQRNKRGIQHKCKPCMALINKKHYDAQVLVLEAEIEEKRCPVCNIVKPWTEFYKRAKARDGLQYYCKVCHNEKVLQKRAERQQSSDARTPA